jgi:DNA-binding NarL/FixJ family response regulator
LRVLIADDEPMLRSIIAEFLDTLHFCVHAQAGDGAEALEAIRSGPIDCVLSDIRMPRMDLEELLAVIARDHPGLTVIATSGYSDLDKARRIMDRGANEFLAKPLDLDALERALNWIPARRRILDRAAELFAEPAAVHALDAEARLTALADALTENAGPFALVLEGARRVARLCPLLAAAEDPAAVVELRLAALLHEVGVSEQLLATIAEPRRLRPHELELVRLQPKLAARLIRRALPQRPAADIVEPHLDWARADPARESDWSDAERLSVLLGLANAIDAMLHDRPDRPALTPDRVRAELMSLDAKTRLVPIKLALSMWDRFADHPDAG